LGIAVRLTDTVLTTYKRDDNERPKDRHYEANGRSCSDTRRERYNSNNQEGNECADQGGRSANRDKQYAEQRQDHREEKISNQSHHERYDNRSHQSLEGSRVSEHREDGGSRSRNDSTEAHESKDRGLNDSQRDDRIHLPPLDGERPTGLPSNDIGSPVNTVGDSQYDDELFSTEFLDE